MRASEIAVYVLCVIIIAIIWTAVIVALARYLEVGRGSEAAPKPKRAPPAPKIPIEIPKTRAQRLAEAYRGLVYTHPLQRYYGRFWEEDEETPLLGQLTGSGLAPYRDVSPMRRGPGSTGSRSGDEAV